MRILTSIVSHAVAVAVAAWILPGIRIGGRTMEITDKILPVLAVGLILAIVAAIVKPIVTLLSLPLVILTLGLFLLVINAVMLLLVEWIAQGLDIRFVVTSFGWAFLGALIITIVTRAVDSVVESD